MTDAPIIQADFVKPQPVPSRKVLQLVFEVPEEAADHAMAILGGFPQSGKNRWCAIARLADTGAAEAQETQPVPAVVDDASPTALWTEAKRKMVQQSGILRKETAFQDWLMESYPVDWRVRPEFVGLADPYDITSALVHDYCGVESCADLDPAGHSGARWQAMVGNYRASQHGETDPERERQLEAGPR